MSPRPFCRELALCLVTDPEGSRRWRNARTRVRFQGISTRRILYWLVAMVALLVVGTIIGLIWADTNDAAGAFAGVTNVISVVGIVVLVAVLAVKRHRRLR